MRLPVEILSLIFSFLVSDIATLTACSKDPLLFPVVEKHLYYHVTVCFGCKTDGHLNGFRPDDFSKRISENPRIVHYVRILQFQLNYISMEQNKGLSTFAKTLRMLPGLESIRFSGIAYIEFPDAFQVALKDRLGQPTVKEVRMAGGMNSIPFSWFDSSKNLEALFLSGSVNVMGTSSFDSNLPQLKTLSMESDFGYLCPEFVAWVELHVNKLQSLRLSAQLQYLSRMCPETLNKLDICLHNTRCKV